MPDAVKNLLIGDVLQLQYATPSDNKDRYAVKLIGYVPGQSLIITTPGKQGKAILVREGQSFTVRVLQGSNIFGFVAKVMAVYSHPYPHLHLAYPEEVETAVVRNAPRVTTRFEAKVINSSLGDDQRQILSATIVDLSSTGARLWMSQRLGQVGHRVQLMLNLQVCGSVDRLQLLGNIRSIREAAHESGIRGYTLGLQFKTLDRHQQLLLCAFVLGEINKEQG